MITKERLDELFFFDEEICRFIWRKTSGGKSKRGSIAGNKDNRGRIRICIDGRSYFLHRLIWLHHYGEMPKGIIDHINGNCTDNRIENLRDTTLSMNSRNLKKLDKNTSGYCGVNDRGNGTFTARIRVNGEKKNLGTFKSAYDAHIAYESEKLKNGFTPDHGIRTGHN